MLERLNPDVMREFFDECDRPTETEVDSVYGKAYPIQFPETRDMLRMTVRNLIGQLRKAKRNGNLIEVMAAFDEGHRACEATLPEWTAETYSSMRNRMTDAALELI